MHGCSQAAGCTDTSCPAGSLAFVVGGRLHTGRDATLIVNIQPPGGLYGEINGPNGGVKAGGVASSCIASNGRSTDDGWTTDAIYFTGSSCGVYYHASTPGTGVAFSCVCAKGSWYAVNNSGATVHTAPSCDSGSLMVTDLVQVTESSQPYESGVPDWLNFSSARANVPHVSMQEARLSFNYQGLLRYAVQYCDATNPCGASYMGRGGDCSHFLAHMLSAGGLTIQNANPKRNCPSGLVHSNSEILSALKQLGPGLAQPIYNLGDAQRGDIAFLYKGGVGGPHHGMILAGKVVNNCAEVYCHTDNRCAEKLCSSELVGPIFRISPGMSARTIVITTSSHLDSNSVNESV